MHRTVRQTLATFAGWAVAAGLVAAPVQAGTSSVAQAAPVASSPDAVGLAVVSNRADLVSGGDALVEVMLPRGVRVSDVKVDAAGRDVTDAFALRPDGRVLGLVTGLEIGDNVPEPARCPRRRSRTTRSPTAEAPFTSGTSAAWRPPGSCPA